MDAVGSGAGTGSMNAPVSARVFATAKDSAEVGMKEAEHRQLEGESLVEAARERAVAWEACECESDEQLLREALEALEHMLVNSVYYQAQARRTITKLEERLLRE